MSKKKKVFDRKVWDAKLAALGKPFLVRNYNDGGDTAAAMIATEAIPMPEATEFVRTYSFKFAKSVNDETERRLRRQLVQAFERGEGIGDIKKRMHRVFDDLTSNHAELIARTETARAQTAGFREQIKGSVKYFIWDAAGDACPWCTDMDGKRVAPDENFFEIGDKLEVDGSTMDFEYDVVQGPPLHPDCRCSLTAG